MFDHVTLRVSEFDASRRFYSTVLPALEIGETTNEDWIAEWDDFSISPTDGRVTRRVHVGFVAPSREHVEAFWEAGRSAGYPDDGEPGPRPQYRYDYYGSFLLDPDGNSAEAVHHNSPRVGGVIDHVWIRVSDVAAARRFFCTIAREAGLHLAHDEPDRVQFGGESGSFTLVRGEPTEHLHMAFGASDDATVDAFHREAVDAGYRDGGAPGERPQYHPGYYGAFVLDPDGNNIEVVNHNR